MRELPNIPSRLLCKAVAAARKEKYGRAKRLLRRQLKSTPYDYWALAWYANCLYQCAKGPSEQKEACNYYKIAIKLAPREAFARIGLGIIHYDNSSRIVRGYSFAPWASELMLAQADPVCCSRKVAIKQLERGAGLLTDVDEKIEYLAMAAEVRCEIDNHDGIEAFGAIIRLDPNHVHSHFHLGGAYASTGQSEKAFNELAFVEAHAPDLLEDLKNVFREFGLIKA